MKILITIVILVCYVTGVNATILRCNNNPGVTGTYQTFYDALLAASPGDTIHLEPSPISYGKVGGYPENLTQQPINKDSLTIIGNGINLSNHPGLQMDTLSSKIEFLSAQGNYWNFYSVDGQAAIFLYGHHNLFENCRFTFIRIYYHSNKISHCYFPIAVGSNPFLDVKNACLVFHEGTHDIEISNSFIGKHIEMDSNNSYNINFMYNTFHDSVSVNGASYQVSHFFNTTFINNIFKTNANGIDTSGNNIFINNICINNSIVLPAVNGNVSGVNPSLLFANPSSRLEEDQQLLPSYPVQNVGMYGGIDPYIPGKLPPVPSIFQLTVPSLIQSNTGTITISTRANQ